jgi:hypothetical protein
MPQIVRAKSARSPSLAKPASWELRLSRTSISRVTPAACSRPKKCAALVWVKPMVKSLMPHLLDAAERCRVFLCRRVAAKRAEFGCILPNSPGNAAADKTRILC